MTVALREAYAYCESVTRRSHSTFELAISLVFRPRDLPRSEAPRADASHQETSVHTERTTETQRRDHDD